MRFGTPVVPLESIATADPASVGHVSIEIALAKYRQRRLATRQLNDGSA
jgi:hypothetical protein